MSIPNNTFFKLDIFMARMKRLGIEIKLAGNVPWIYLESVNGHRIKEEDYFYGNHGFTIGWYPIRIEDTFRFTDLSEIFKIIRKYR